MQGAIHNPSHFVRRSPGTQNTKEYSEVKVDIRLILEAAGKLGIRWRLVPDADLVELTWKDKKKYFRNTHPTSLSPARNICADKAITNSFVREAGLNAPKGFIVLPSDSDEYIARVFAELQAPVVVKLTNNSHGDGVIVGATTAKACSNYVRELYTSAHYKKEGTVLIEEMFVGKEFRIVATRDRVLGIMHRIPASITGDGVHSIKELIELKNQLPIRNIDHMLYPHITWDAEMAEIVAGQAMDEDSIPANEQKVVLRKISNVMAGGDAIDYTDRVHESVKQIAIEAIRAIPGLKFGGLDFMTVDEAIQQTKDTYTIIEINSAPEFAMHDIPMEGIPRNICYEFLCLMFPELKK